ncbi:MAG: acetyl/propionyl-CoA carboxylase subunit alpha [Actinomycetota bacterium]|nr:acetyl/propionyl-CoA carboxylase subunit alpha [Actinomycetota bacterium]
MFSSVLVANRGEIAVRVIVTLRRLGIRSIAVYSNPDADAPHVDLADVAVALGSARSDQTYLSIERLLAAARDSGAEAVHPGYGFLSESPAFARACRDDGLVFVGPPPEAMELLGDKVRAKQAAEQEGVPVLPGRQGAALSDEEIEAFAAADGRLPLMIKAAAGGGGRGMRIVHSLSELPESLAAARREAQAGFGEDSVFIERYLERARHIEIQLLADQHGSVVHLGERECSLQRRHQKIVEESPSPAVGPQMRERMGQAAIAIARRAGYEGAGTAEFLCPSADPDQFFFLEVNARLQVEHPVTEAVTGLDLVEQQLLIAAGAPLGFSQDDVRLNGHAIEVRVTAEDPQAGFLPATGRIAVYREPSGPGVRVDSGVRAGSEVTPFFDSLLAKVIACGRDREQALERLTTAVHDVRILGLSTNAGFLHRLLTSEAMHTGELDTGLLEREPTGRAPDPSEITAAAIATAAIETLALYDGAGPGPGMGDPWRSLVGFRIEGSAPLRWELERPGSDDVIAVDIEGPPHRATLRLGERHHALDAAEVAERVRVTVDRHARLWDHAVHGAYRWVAAGPDAFAFRLREPVVQSADAASDGALEAPMPGTVLSVRVDRGDEVGEGDVLVVMESMKMELSLVAPGPGVVAEVHVGAGDGVRQGQPLVELQ